MPKISPQKSLFLGPKISGAMLPCSPISGMGAILSSARSLLFTWAVTFWAIIKN